MPAAACKSHKNKVSSLEHQALPSCSKVITLPNTIKQCSRNVASYYLWLVARCTHCKLKPLLGKDELLETTAFLKDSTALEKSDSNQKAGRNKPPIIKRQNQILREMFHELAKLMVSEGLYKMVLFKQTKSQSHCKISAVGWICNQLKSQTKLLYPSVMTLPPLQFQGSQHINTFIIFKLSRAGARDNCCWGAS